VKVVGYAFLPPDSHRLSCVSLPGAPQLLDERIEAGIRQDPVQPLEVKDARRSSGGPTCPPTSATPGAPPVSCPLPWSFSVALEALGVGPIRQPLLGQRDERGGAESRFAERPGMTRRWVSVEQR